MEMKPGSIIRSTAGRDSGRFYVVMAVDGGYASIADGKVHKAEHPKRKSLKHLAGTLHTVSLSETGTNPKLRRVLRRWNETASGVTE